jgi:hypothetical protein
MRIKERKIERMNNVMLLVFNDAIISILLHHGLSWAAQKGHGLTKSQYLMPADFKNSGPSC